VTPPSAHTGVTVSCDDCGGALEFIAAPTGGWWAHTKHPDDNHAGVTQFPVHEEMDSQGHYRVVGIGYTPTYLDVSLAAPAAKPRNKKKRMTLDVPDPTHVQLRVWLIEHHTDWQKLATVFVQRLLSDNEFAELMERHTQCPTP